MLSFKDYFNLVSEAIPMNKVRDWGLQKKNSKAYRIPILNKIFGNKHRLIYDLNIELDYEEIYDSSISGTDEDVFVEVEAVLWDNEYFVNIENYVKGVAYKADDEDRKQPHKIGKLLNKFNEPELGVKFRDDKFRQLKSGNFNVVISRHPYDIYGMSTDRSWSSCLRMPGDNFPVYKKTYKYRDPITGKIKKDKGGDFCDKVTYEVKYGSIIAYLVNSKEVTNGKTSLRRPLSRILMKPYMNITNDQDYAYSIGPAYGAEIEEFSDFVERWVENNINTNTNGKVYMRNPNLYDDHNRGETINFEVGSLSIKQFHAKIREYGDVNLYQVGANEFADNALIDIGYSLLIPIKEFTNNEEEFKEKIDKLSNSDEITIYKNYIKKFLTHESLGQKVDIKIYRDNLIISIQYKNKNFPIDISGLESLDKVMRGLAESSKEIFNEDWKPEFIKNINNYLDNL